jgi:hypothetical protein
MAPLLIDHGCRSSRRVALVSQAALSSKVAHLPALEAWKVAGRKLLWWHVGSLLRQWSRGTVALLLLRLLLLELPRLELWVMAPILLLLWLTQLTPRWGIHHAVLWRSIARTTTASGSRHHPLPLFSSASGMPFIILSWSMAALANSLYDKLERCTSCSCRWMVSPARYRWPSFHPYQCGRCHIEPGC